MSIIDLTGVQHHPVITEMVDVLCAKTQNTDRGFFSVEAAFFISKMAATQRATIKTKDRGDIPVNAYALALATSGYGKGHSISIIENEFMKGFQKRFMEDTFPTISEQHIHAIANDRAARLGSDQQEEIEKIEKEFRSAGAYPFTFDSGTSPAVKQLRYKLLLAGCGAINLQIDEIGSNLIGNTEVLTLFLELFDQGHVKQKLIKNTADNQRGEEVDGKTPTNMLLFGTPAKLLDGGMNEEQFYSFLDIGYARRCFFGHGQHHKRAWETMDPAEIYRRLTQQNNASSINKWFNHFHQLADPAMFGWQMTVDDDVAIQLLTYKIECEKAAEKLKEHQEIQKAELSHRYFKALKLAGAFAFVDKSTEVEMDHLMSAILLTEESGQAFQQILNREKSYVKLARYIADVGTPLTHADLTEALPFYGKGNAHRQEMITLATAWGYRNHVVIKKTFMDGIELFEGESLEETNLDEMIVSYSEHFAYNYLGEKVPWDQMHVLTQAAGMNWCNHHFKNEHRAEENAHPGFNFITIDIDGGVTLETVHELLKDYRFLTYTTKRHTDDAHRFRLLLPTNYLLKLDTEDYREMVNSVLSWLPFEADDASNQRSKKWLSHPGKHHYNDGQLFDVLDFIPKTTRNEHFKEQTKELGSLDNLERWFAQKIAQGNRNNHMIKFALALVDSGMGLVDVSKAVHSFNSKLNTPLAESEIDNTIMVTVGKRYVKP